MGSDRYGYWFPLALLGFSLLGLLGLDSVREPADVGWFAYTPQAGTRFLSVEQHSVTLFAESRRYVDYLPMSDGPWAYPPRDWPWPAIVILTFLATVAWYGWRARRAGASSGRPFMWLALGGGVALALAYVVAAWAAAVPNPSEVVTTLGLPLAVLGVVAGAWAYFRLGPGRRPAAVISGASLLASVSTVLGAQAPVLVDPVIIAAGLLVLARLERSILLALAAVAALAAMAVFPVGVLSMLLPAAVLLATAIAALVRRGGPTADATSTT